MSPKSSLSRIALILPLLAAACSGEPETKTILSRDGSKTEITAGEDGGSTMVTTSTDGSRSVVTTGGSWPSDAPDFAVRYPGSDVTSSTTGAGERTTGGMVSFTTSDSPDRVVSYYRSQAAAASLDDASGAEEGDTRVFGANDRVRGRAFGIRVKPDGSVTRVTLTYSTRTP